MSGMAPLALITGAGSGIGHALAQRLLARGHDIVAIGRRRAPLDALAAQAPQRVLPLDLDITADDAPQRVLAALGERVPDRIVHNAATLEPAGPLAGIERAALRAHLETNLVAPLFLTQAFLPRLPRGARVLHISSGAAHRPQAGWGPYCMSKSAFHMLYQCWQTELAERGILVGSARPGVVDTPMQETIRGLSAEAFPAVNRFRRLKSDGALLAPTTVARFLAWLLLDADDTTFTVHEHDVRDDALAPHWHTPD